MLAVRYLLRAHVWSVTVEYLIGVVILVAIVFFFKKKSRKTATQRRTYIVEETTSKSVARGSKFMDD